MNVLAEFAQKWSHPDSFLTPVTRADLDAVQLELGIRFPQDYRFQVLTVGLPHPTLALSSSILGRNVDLFDLSDLHDPQTILEQTRGWHQAGMPAWMVAIGSDSLGNIFGFDMRELRTGQVAQAAVFFWDHDFGEVTPVADSFNAWIESYLGAWADGLSYADF